MNVAVQEMSHYVESDFMVVNRDFDQALIELHSIVTSQRLVTSRQQVVLQDMLRDLLN
jgi:guanylate kinase